MPRTYHVLDENDRGELVEVVERVQTTSRGISSLMRRLRPSAVQPAGGGGGGLFVLLGRTDATAAGTAPEFLPARVSSTQANGVLVTRVASIAEDGSIAEGVGIGPGSARELVYNLTRWDVGPGHENIYLQCIKVGKVWAYAPFTLDHVPGYAPGTPQSIGTDPPDGAPTWQADFICSDPDASNGSA